MNSHTGKNATLHTSEQTSLQRSKLNARGISGENTSSLKSLFSNSPIYNYDFKGIYNSDRSGIFSQEVENIPSSLSDDLKLHYSLKKQYAAFLNSEALEGGFGFKPTESVSLDYYEGNILPPAFNPSGQADHDGLNVDLINIHGHPNIKVNRFDTIDMTNEVNPAGLRMDNSNNSGSSPDATTSRLESLGDYLNNK